MASDPSSFDLNLLKVFHAVHVAGSVSNAAEKLGLTQSGVSHALRKLRSQLGDELFVRTGSTMVPTARAEALVEPVRSIMESVDRDVLSTTGFDPAQARMEFSLAMVDMAEVVFLPPLMQHVRKVAPNCTLRTRRMPNEQMVQALENGAVHMAIGAVPEAPDNVYAQTLFQHDYVVLAWDQHPRLKGSLTWKSYQREQHIVVAAGSDSRLVEGTLQPMGISRSVFLTVGGFLSVPWLIQGTDLLATVPTRLSEDLAKAARVRQMALPSPAKPYALQSLWHPRVHNDPAHRWLRESIYALMHAYPDLGEVV